VRNVTLVHDSFHCQQQDMMGRDNRPIPVRRVSKHDFIGNSASQIFIVDSCIACSSFVITTAYLPENDYQGLLLNKRCPVACRPFMSWEWC
jgi:hypothetical protein